MFESAEKLIAWSIFGLLIAFEIAVLARSTTGVYSDAAWGLVAAEQSLVGTSHSLTHLSVASPANLSLSIAERITWWPPGYQAIPALFRRCGLSLGSAIGATIGIAWLFGIFGWMFYFRTVLRDPALLGWLGVLFVSFPYSHGNFHNYSGGEYLLWAFFPLALLLTLYGQVVTESRRARFLSFAGGLAATSLFLVKYLVLYYCAGMGAYLFHQAWRHRAKRARFACWALGALLGGGIVLVCGVPGGTTPGSGLLRLNGLSTLALHLVAASSVMTELVSPLSNLKRNPAHAGFTDGQMTLVLLLLTLFVGASCHILLKSDPRAATLKSQAQKQSLYLGGWIFVVVTTLLALFRIEGAVDYRDVRYSRIVAIILLPFVFRLAMLVVRRGTRMAASTAGVFLVLYFIFPAAYGWTLLIRRGVLHEAASPALVGPAGVRTDVLGKGANAMDFYREITGLIGKGAIFYLPAPDLALPLVKERLIISQAIHESPEQLRQRFYRGFPEEGVMLLLPKALISNGNADLIKKSFLDIPAWKEIRLASAPEWRAFVSVRQ